MFDSIKYSGLITKIRAMESNMLTFQNYKDMSNLQTVSDIAIYLKQCKAYSYALSDIDENNIHRGQLEKRLMYSMYKDYERIYKFTDGDDRHFLNSYFIYFEVEILKTLLRMVFDLRPIEYDLKDFEKFFEDHSDIDIKKLSTSKNLTEFLEALKNTKYYIILEPLYNIGTISLFDIEMQLDLYYFSETWKLKNKYLKGRNNKVVTYTFGSRIDILNILWIYRAKTYYDINKDIIYTYVIPIRFKLKKSDLKQMIEAKTSEELEAAIKNTSYSKILLSLADKTKEESYFSILNKLHHKANTQNSMSLAPVRYFMYRKKAELANIIKIIEGIRYNLKPEEIIGYLDIYDRLEV